MKNEIMTEKLPTILPDTDLGVISIPCCIKAPKNIKQFTQGQK